MIFGGRCGDCESATDTLPCPLCAPGDSVHVTPRNDLIKHDATDDCACGPRSDPVTCDDGTVGWVVVHHSLDGRESSPAGPDADGGDVR